jgi:hypothetical protein
MRGPPVQPGAVGSGNREKLRANSRTIPADGEPVKIDRPSAAETDRRQLSLTRLEAVIEDCWTGSDPGDAPDDRHFA